MRITIIFLCLGLSLGLMLVAGDSHSGGGHSGKMPPLDVTLMGFLEQGVWYFPCFAPMYPHRIPPHYLVYGPPPPPCGPFPGVLPGRGVIPVNGNASMAPVMPANAVE